MLRLLVVPLITLASFAIGSPSEPASPENKNPDFNPHLTQQAVVQDGAVLFRISGILQPNDSQYVHDVLCAETGENLGTVRMMWAFKYGSRYGGVGVAVTRGLEYTWIGDNGWVKIKLPPNSECKAVNVVPRIAAIPKE